MGKRGARAVVKKHDLWRLIFPLARGKSLKGKLLESGQKLPYCFRNAARKGKKSAFRRERQPLPRGAPHSVKKRRARQKKGGEMVTI